jgi:hypothetical protein
MMTTNPMTATSTVIALAIAAFATIGCSSHVSQEPESSSVGEPLANTGGGGSQGYTCTDAGYCQCSGLEDCNNMFGVCKSHLYCNYDTAGGLRCCCWNFALRTGGGLTPPPPGGVVTVSQ